MSLEAFFDFIDSQFHSKSSQEDPDSELELDEADD